MSKWKIPQSLKLFVRELFPEGTYIECKICTEWDDDGKQISSVQMQKKCCNERNAYEKCEKGSIANTRKFKSLTGRWFGEEKKETMCEQGIILE